MTKRVLLTGAGGFVGSHVLRHLLINTDWEIVCPVTFRHRGNQDRIFSAMVDVPGMLKYDELNRKYHKRVQVVLWDLTAPASSTIIDRIGAIDYVLNVASESHVDRSITDPVPFIRNNVDLILNVLEYCRQVRPEKILHMSTDEVFGPAAQGYEHKEWDHLLPSNPYSGSKGAQEAIAISYWRTYGLPITITNTMNIIGEMQDTEKFVPYIMRSLLYGEPITVHVDENGAPGSRFYLHARNLADAWLWLLNCDGAFNTYSRSFGEPQRFNIVGEREVTNIEMVEMIAAMMQVPKVDYRLKPVDFHSSRPGHDRRYALDGTKLRDWGWTAPRELEESLRTTIDWTLAHPEWLTS